MMNSILISGITFRTAALPTANSIVLLVQGSRANLGCGYFSMAAAEKMHDRFAVARGVSSIEELLEAPVADLSPEAAACGVVPGMKGREALLLMEKDGIPASQ